MKGLYQMRKFLTILLVFSFFILSVVLTGCIKKSEILLKESFEGEVFEWSIGKDLPIDPNTQLPVNASAWITDSRARTGNMSLVLQIDGRQDDGTIWIQRSINLTDMKDGKIRIAFYVFNEETSFNVIAKVVAFIGVIAPSNESDFVELGNANRESGWIEFYLEKQFQFEKTHSELWVAIGITVAWETMLKYEVDDITVTAEYRL